ncbi:MAG: isochorismatase family protein [Microbacteriaceae bacterium]
MAGNTLELMTADNSVLLLVDYQRAMYAGVGSSDRNAVNDSAVALATAAQILDVPVVLSSIWPDGNGEFNAQIAGLFPNQQVISRSILGFDALEDEAVLAAVKATGRSKLVVSGLWTSMCFAFTAIHGVRAGMDVYAAIDAAGDWNLDTHNYGVQRMVQAGVVPTTWMPTVSEWMHDWGNPKADQLKQEVYGRYDCVLGM